MRQSAVPPFVNLPIEPARETYRRQSHKLGGEQIAVAAVEAGTAIGPAAAIPVRLYRPLGLAPGPTPALVY